MKDIQRDVIDKITPEIREEMEHIWFVGDLHHGHPKIVDICNRPVYIPEKEISHISKDQRNLGTPEYKQILDATHNEWLVKEVYNKYIEKKDRVFLLGDVSLQNKVSAEKFLDTFSKYKQMDKVKLVHSNKGWALFITGELLEPKVYKSERRV